MFEMIFVAVWFGSAACLLAVLSRREWSQLAAVLRVYLLVSWALVTLGVLQVLVTPFRYAELTEAALWFAAAGFAIALTGGVNLLNLRARLGELTLKRVCLAANVAVTILFVAIATHRGAETLHDPVSAVMLAVGVTAIALSGRRQSFLSRDEAAS